MYVSVLKVAIDGTMQHQHEQHMQRPRDSRLDRWGARAREEDEGRVGEFGLDQGGFNTPHFCPPLYEEDEVLWCVMMIIE